MLKSLPRDVPEMDTLDYVTLMTVKDMAAGMSKDEILATFSIEWDDLEKTEQIYFDEFMAFGKGMAINLVVQNLLDGTKGRAGTQAAMQFLKRFAKEFESDVEGDSSGSFSFQFGKAE
tara:strand:+ start:88 stop:441 length:354 start_codon:yes stop_codon:yes gene_type:complete